MAGMALLGELDACAWKIKSLKKKEKQGKIKDQKNKNWLHHNTKNKQKS